MMRALHPPAVYERLTEPLVLQLDGLNESSRQMLRNLDVAITVARRPGYHAYFEPSEEVKKVRALDAL
jgi:hypothetical protein